MRRCTPYEARFYGWPEDAKFLVPDGVYDHFKAGIGKRDASPAEEVDGIFFAAYRAEISGTRDRD